MERLNGLCHKSPPQKVLIVDDHVIVRQGLALLINQMENLAVCAEADDAETALRLITELKPDLVVLDISLKKMGGLELLGQIKAAHEDLPVLILSMHHESFYVERALKAGANGYVVKEERAENLLLAIQTVLEGEIYLDKTLRNQILNSYFGRKPERNGAMLERLTNRESEVLQLIGRGCDTRQIANLMHISVKTVESHQSNIKEKLALKSKTELMQYAFKLEQSAATS